MGKAGMNVPMERAPSDNHEHGGGGAVKQWDGEMERGFFSSSGV
jgi:hypothetical protein